MDRNATFKEKYAHLDAWLPLIIDTVKKDLKNEHLKKDHVFVKLYLSSKNPLKLTLEDLVNGYRRAIAEDERGEQIAEFITARWLLKNSEVYDFYEKNLSSINPNFSALEKLDHTQARQLIDQSIKSFGAPVTYLFAVLNSVVFSPDIFRELREKAEKAIAEEKTQQIKQQELLTAEKMKESYEREIARLKEKYENKLEALERKYLTDTEGLKKQIAALQRRLSQ